MSKSIQLKLLKIKYNGNSIGDDIRFEIEVARDLFTREQKMKAGETFEFNQEINKLELKDDILDIPIRIKIIEKDILFSDSGEVKGIIHIDIRKFPQTFNFEIKVQEKNKVVKKSTAFFTITLLLDFPHSNLRQYKSPKSGQNYNQYDVAIYDAVKYWNNEFFNQTNPITTFLDPNLVKAIIYVESKMGYYVPSSNYIKKNPNYYRSNPDLMQVGDPRNGSLFVLKNIENPKTGKKNTEFEIINGKEVTIEYPEANIDTPEQSIYWGVRWLFRKARENIKQADGSWTRKWLDWKETLRRYNVGDPGYVDKVYKVYEQGVGERKFKLWQLVGVMVLMLLLTGSFFVDYDKLDDPFINFHDGSAIALDANYRMAERIDLKDSALILNRSLYSMANCKFAKDSWLWEDVLKNCTYTVGPNSSDLWSIKLANGNYNWNPKDKETQIIGHVYENNGPYYIEYQKGKIGDLNNDSRDDAVVVLRLNNGGNAMISNIVVLIQNKDGEMEQYASYIMQDREDIENLYINRGIISVNVFIKSEDDPQCCASVYDTYR
ncbi:MAG: hypothetical protein UU24_C0030G0014, partial [Candidatus Nomurabacteria bacterium GW2011_GWA2_40_9]